MLTLSALAKTLPLAALIAATSFGLTVGGADAQEGVRGEREVRVFKKPHRGPAIGGTSWTLSDVWGEPEMPEQSQESPGYDYAPGGYDLNGPPNQSPYPN